MAGIKVTPNQYADVTIAFLLDAMMKPDEVLPNNPEFHYIIKKMQKAGLKSQLMSYYLDTSSITRGKYKVVRKSFTGKSDNNNIQITKSPDTKIPDDAKTTIRNIVKQTLKIIKSHKLNRNNGMPLNEKTVDKIIDKVLENN
jgi:hypothetical protein